MYRNRQLSLDGVFSYNQLLVNGVDVAPTIQANSQDISYIYNDGLVNTSNDTLNNANNLESISTLTQTNSTNIANLQTGLNNQIQQEAADIANLNYSINNTNTNLNNFTTQTNNKINQINTQLQNLPTNNGLSSTQLTALQNSIQSNTTAITNLTTQESTDISNLQTQITTNKNNINSNTTLINNLTTKETNDILNLQTQITKNATDISNINLGSLTAQTTANSSLINSLISTVNSNNLSLQTSLNNLTIKESSDISGLQTQISKNTTDITTLKASTYSSGSGTISLPSTYQTTSYINNLYPNTIGYQIYQQILMSGYQYYLTHNTSASTTSLTQLCSFPLTPIGSLWIIVMNLTPGGGLLSTTNRFMNCYIVVTDNQGVYLYNTIQICDFQYLSAITFTFMYYNRSGGNVKVLANTCGYISSEKYYFQNLSYIATRIG